ncbi:hypothetical protein [Sagittula sp. NFXS13]
MLKDHLLARRSKELVTMKMDHGHLLGMAGAQVVTVMHFDGVA